MDILETLQQDYQRFPKEQTFEIYVENVFFKDPLNQFWGIDRYQKMIGFLDRWFSNIQLDLHKIERENQSIRTDWTLFLTCPLPWKPRLKISGSSLLELNDQDLIFAHIDYWDDTPVKVFMQLFQTAKAL